jgi:hypothetical protein
MSRDPTRTCDDRESLDKTNQNSGTALRDFKDRVSDVASKAKDKAGQVADAVSEKLGQQRKNVADTLGRVAFTMHGKADIIPGGTRAVNLTHSVADGLESTASYLRDHNFRQMGKVVTDVSRRYPMQSLVGALAFGFLLGRLARRK